jgi:hypothetical protein
MDRFTEELPSRLAHMMRVWGEEQTKSNPGAIEEQYVRDVVEEQITGSTDAELAERLSVLLDRSRRQGGLRMADGWELRDIEREQGKRQYRPQLEVKENVWVG